MNKTVLIIFLSVLPLNYSCGDSDSSSTESTTLIIPDGVYKSTKSIVLGETTTHTTAMTCTVTHDNEYTVFTLQGTQTNGTEKYSCNPRVWKAKIDKDGKASNISRTEENCTSSMNKAAYESLKRVYKINSTGFSEVVSDNEIQFEYFYEK